MAIRAPRIRRSCSSEAAIRSVPSASTAEPLIFALFDLVSPISVMALTDFPDPDSPTIDSTSPRRRLNETSFTAWTTPCSVRKSTFRWETSRTASFAGAVMTKHS